MRVGLAWPPRWQSTRPFVIDALVDLSVLPPHVTVEQTKNYLAAVLERDREADCVRSFKHALLIGPRRNCLRDKWIADPKAILPDFPMAVTFQGIPDANERADIIAYLRTQ